jgi:hypothetical protein
MKITLLTLFTIILTTPLFAQKIEVSVQANSGLFRYSGNGTTSVSSINYAQPPFNSYPNYSYGNKNGFSYGASIQGQYVAKCGFIVGLQTGYDILRSKAAINSINGELYNYSDGPLTIITPVNGSSIVQNQFINVNPYIGYRLPVKKIKIDLLLGADLPFGVNSYEKSRSVAADGTVYQTNVNYGKGGFDPRARFGIAASYKRFGINASYAHGIINHSADLLNDSPILYEAHSELFRFGVTYRIAPLSPL